MRDEIAAISVCKKVGLDSDSSYFECAFVLQCITKWEGISSVTIDHILDLHRSDAQKLRLELAKLEALDGQGGEENAAKNLSGGEA